ncbi:DgyrCDS13634 [Dimorphilus gyrociliatus]|uniref:non-specific serine/threonine protein kinase n=1 Tax=Dimorphilus gyrociliatus TaxID=2664684 RepID=A0A7I8WBB4_9ANNE|nr:DgyrCDS13634 [Dimorphilus gyrociliatus]
MTEPIIWENQRLEVLHELGKGACAIVHLVKHEGNKELYALKKIELDESRKTRTKDAVVKEANIMATLKHPHIVTYRASFFDANERNLFIVLDYCDGGTLDDKIREAVKNEQNIPERDVLRYFLQITQALRFLHSHKILHRDVKSSNVFLNRSASTCKLGDFGIAKMMNETMDKASTCVGTPCYLSPEMCQDIPYSSQSDIWALGCLLYELCALKPAFDAHNLISLFYKIVQCQYEPIPKYYSDGLREVLDKVLTKIPEERPSAKAILSLPFIKEELTKYIDNLSITCQSRGRKDRPNTSPPNNVDPNAFRRRVASCKGVFGTIREEERPQSSLSTSETLKLSQEYEGGNDAEDEDDPDDTWKGAAMEGAVMDGSMSLSPTSSSDLGSHTPSPHLTPRKLQHPPQILQMQLPSGGESPRDKTRQKGKLAPLLSKPNIKDENKKVGEISIKGKGVTSPPLRSTKSNLQKSVDLPTVSVSFATESNIVNATDCYSDDFDSDKEGIESCEEGLHWRAVFSLKLMQVYLFLDIPEEISSGEQLLTTKCLRATSYCSSNYADMSEIPEDIADESNEQFSIYDNDFEEDIDEDVEEIISVAKDVCRIKEESDEEDQVVFGDGEDLTYSLLHEQCKTALGEETYKTVCKLYQKNFEIEPAKLEGVVGKEKLQPAYLMGAIMRN